MKKFVAILCFSALLLAPGALLAEEAATQTLTGEYQWNRPDEKPGPIKAVFTATDKEGTWDVSFHFNFRDEDHIWSGQAKGSLTDGELSGEVMSDGDKPSPFVFEGKFEDGVFTGTHAGLRDGERRDTGTITLSRS